MRKILGSSLSILLTLFAVQARADQIPDCPDLDGSALPVINEYVLKWKQTKPNLYKHRARVRGYLTQLYPDRNGHQHFKIQIGPNSSTDTLEVVYNEEFGALPNLQRDAKVEACGDFIVSNAPAEFPKSPDDAIIHWVHTNPSGRGHPPGYLAIDGVVYGQDVGGNSGRP